VGVSSSVTLAPVDPELAPSPWDDDREGAQVALVDAARDPVSETLTASVRRTGASAFEVVEPRAFVFTRLRAGVVVGLGVWVGTWRGTLEIDPRPVAPGDAFDLRLSGGWG
jgi:hypothetical protein